MPPGPAAGRPRRWACGRSGRGLICPGAAGQELRDRFAGIGMAVDGARGPEEFMASLRGAWATFDPVIRQLGIRAE